MAPTFLERVRVHLNCFKEKNHKVIDNSSLSIILDDAHALLNELVNIKEAVRIYPEIEELLTFLSQSSTVITNKILYSKLLNCYLLILHEVKREPFSDKIKTWILNMIRSTIQGPGCKSNSLLDLGFPTSEVISKQIQQNAKQIKDLVRVGQNDINADMTEKVSIVKKLCVKMKDILLLEETLPILDAILNILVKVPTQLLDTDIHNMLDTIHLKVKSKEIFLEYDMYIKLWKLNIAFLEKDVLLLIEDCRYCILLPSIIEQKLSDSYMVKCCNEDYEIFYTVFNILYTLMIQSNCNTAITEFITCFLFQITNKMCRLVFPVEYNSLYQSLSQNPIGLSLESLCYQVQHIVSCITTIPRQNTVDRLTLYILLLKHKQWYFTVLKNIFLLPSQSVEGCVELLLLYYNLETDQLKNSVVECLLSLQVLVKKKSIKVGDVQYSVYGLMSNQHLRPILRFLLYLFIVQSDSALLIYKQLIYLIKEDDIETILTMLCYIKDVELLDTLSLSVNKQAIYNSMIDDLLHKLQEQCDISCSDNPRQLQSYQVLMESAKLLKV